MQDWLYRYLGCNALTLEISEEKWPAESTLPGYWADNAESMLSYFEAAHMGVRGLVTDAVTGLGVFASVTVAGNDQPVFTDGDVGDYHRMLLPGTYDLTIEAAGYAARTVTAVTVSAGAAARVDVALVGLEAGVLLTAGQWTGQVAVATPDTGVVLTVDDGAGHTGASNAFDVLLLEITTPAALPAARLGWPYSVALEARGGAAPYTWSLVGAGQFEESDAPGGYLGGGSAMGFQDDDASWLLNLPWNFPFYGTDYGSVNVCSNGFLDFASSSTEYGNTTSGLADNVRIAPLWDDLYTDDGDIYVTQTDEYVAVRWEGHTFDFDTPVDFEAVLHRDGRIRFNYGAAHSDLSPTIGVSAGDGADYLLSSRDGAAAIAAGAGSLLTYGGLLPPGLSLDADTGAVSGTPTELGAFAFPVRVRDAGAPAQSDTRDFTLEVADLPELTVTLPDSAVEGDGVLAGRGTVSVAEAVGSDLVVALASDDTTEVALPDPQVTIPAGRTSAAFDLQIEDDDILDGTQAATITASAEGYYPGSAELAVQDNETATLTVSVPATAAEGDGVLADQGTVAVREAVASDVVVELSCDDPTEVTVPATVVLRSGQTSASFDLTVVDDGAIDGARTATITAHVEKWTDGTGAVEIADNEHLDLMVALPGELWESDLPPSGTVSISGTLEAALTISLSCDDPGELLVPATATIPAGETAAPIVLMPRDDGLADGAQPVTVTAGAAGFNAGQAHGQVLDRQLDRFVFAPTGPQLAGEPFAVAVSARNVDDQAVAPYAAHVPLAAVGEGGPVAFEPADASFAGGVWTGPVTVLAVDRGVVLAVDDGLGHAAASDPFDVTAGPVDHFAWGEVASPQQAGAAIDVTLTALDARGYVAGDFAGPVNLAGRAAGAEITIGTGTETSALPLDTYWEDGRTQVIYLAGEIGGACAISSLALDVAALPGQTLDHWTIRMKHTDLDSYPEILLPAWEGSGWTVVYQGDETVSQTGWVSFAFAAPFAYDGVRNLMIDFSFNNDSYSAEGTCRCTETLDVRTIYYNTDSEWGDPLTWSGVGSPLAEPDWIVPNIRLGAGAEVAVTPTAAGAFLDGVWQGQVVVGDLPGGPMRLLADDGLGHTGASGEFLVVPDAVAPRAELAVQPGGVLPQGATDLTVNFTEPVQAVAPADVSLIEAALGPIVPDEVALAGDGLSATLTFSAGLDATDGWDSYALRLRDSVRDLAGNALDGDADGQAGGDYEAAFSVLILGDANGDGCVNWLDIGPVATNYNESGTTWRDGDFSGDGVVNYQDVGMLATLYGSAVPNGGPPRAALEIGPDLELPEPATSLALNFSEPVQPVTADDVLLVGQALGTVAPQTVLQDPDGATVWLVFPAGLAADTYTLTVFDTVRDLSGNALDGDGDGAPGRDYAIVFAVAAAGGAPLTAALAPPVSSDLPDPIAAAL